MIADSMVVLPAPLGPITVTIWPLAHRDAGVGERLDLAVGNAEGSTSNTGRS